MATLSIEARGLAEQARAIVEPVTVTIDRIRKRILYFAKKGAMDGVYNQHKQPLSDEIISHFENEGVKIEFKNERSSDVHGTTYRYCLSWRV